MKNILILVVVAIISFAAVDCQDSWEQFSNVKCSTASPCVNNGTCERSHCRCVNGYTGGLCENAPCSPTMNNGTVYNPCLNNGLCANNATVPRLGLTCACLTGYTGRFCEIQLCSTNPCQNNATCTDKRFGYHCNCTGEFRGRTCNLKACDFPWCGNNATCTNYNNGTFGASCTCTNMAFSGQRCNVQTCSPAPSPCLNGGTCTNLTLNSNMMGFLNFEWSFERAAENIRGYTCSCPSGFQKPNCQPIENQGWWWF